MFAIEINNVSKAYGKFQALKQVSLNVPKGCIFGLLGPNGAGKTTLIKTIAGALKPTGGGAVVLGLDPLKNRWEIRKKIGYMPQHASLYGDLSARQNISFFGKAQGVKNLTQEVNRILEFTELTDRANDKVRNFSGGMQKRVSLACALIHQPEILFLDEPTAAVDPHLKLRTWELFSELSHQGVTIFVSTHLMDEALKCDMLGILRNGELLAADTPSKILALGKTRLNVVKSGQKISKEISSDPDIVLSELKTFGLDSSISKIDIEADDLETILLSLTHKTA
jgi:ABC-2 type transport system ATP-binding protein